MSNLPEKKNAFSAGRPDNLPKLGEWYWVLCDEYEEPTHWIGGKVVDGRGKKNVEVLMCVWHVGSNHVKMSRYQGDQKYDSWNSEIVMLSDVTARLRRELNWKDIFNRQIAEKQIEIQSAVKALGDIVRAGGLINEEQEGDTQTALVPAGMRQDPKETKKALQRIKEKSFPTAQKGVESLMQEMVALQKCFMLPMKAEANRMKHAVENVDERMFVLELYAGVCEESKLIKEGEPAPLNTPITIRQMLRYMDEECLIDYDKGGMNYTKLSQFDAWVVKPENLNRLIPETRSVVAFKIRRHKKDYGRPVSLGDAFAIVKMQQADAATYLLIRNGEQVWRLATEIDFSPRLLPLRKEFHSPLIKEAKWSGEVDKEITVQDFEYDEVMGKRRRQIFEYNRVMFLLQGMLDRSKVFHPHPPMNLSDETVVRESLRLVFDEETGLPSAYPPKWEEYRDQKNALLKKGDAVWSKWYDEETDYAWCPYTKREVLKESRIRPRVVTFMYFTRDKKHVWVRWSKGDRISERWVLDKTRPVPNRPGYYYQKREEINHGERYGNAKIPTEEVFNYSAYVPGEYKPFLCDAYLKGAYLQWAPQLLGAEDWHREKNKTVKE